MNEVELWALREAASAGGFLPHTHEVKEILIGMEVSRLVRRSDVAPVWYATQEGRDELARHGAAL